MRNSIDGEYKVSAAQAQYVSRRCESKGSKLLRCTNLYSYVLDKLNIGWSPEQIAGRLVYEDASDRICHESIYRYIYSAEGIQAMLWKLLPKQQKKRKARGHSDIKHQQKSSNKTCN